MVSEFRDLAKVVTSVLCLTLLVVGSGCDAIKSAAQKKEEASPVPVAPVAEAPATPAPGPAPPAPVAKTPQQIIDEFMAMPSVEKRNEHLQQLAELKEGLDAITSLDLTRSGVSDEGLKTLTAFPKLTELILSDSRVGNAGMVSVAEVQTLRTLTLANLRGLDDIGIQNLSPLKDLVSLTVSACAVSDGVLPTLAGFEGLQVLNLSGNSELYGRDFKVLLAKKAFRNLRELNVNGSKFGWYGLEEIGKLGQLEVLRASGCEAVGKALNLAGCDDLKVLEISRNQMQDDNIKGINRLKKLEELRLAGMPLTDECLKSIRTMKHLKVLDLDSTNVTLEAIKALKEKSLPDTEILAGGQKF